MSKYTKEISAHHLKTDENFKSKTGKFFKCLGFINGRVLAKTLFPPNGKLQFSFSPETKVYVKGGKSA